jgi:hypothetical protein
MDNRCARKNGLAAKTKLSHLGLWLTKGAEGPCGRIKTARKTGNNALFLG